MNRIPQELFCVILDNLSHKADLAAASLVSLSWCQVARPLLFSEISCSGHGKRADSALLDFLVSSPHLASLVKCLIFGRKRDDYRQPPVHATTALLEIILSKLPSIETLHLIYVSFDASELPTQASGAYELQRLAFEDVGHPGDNAADWLEFLSIFSQIGTLHLEGLRLSPASLEQAMTNSNFTSLTSLSISTLDARLSELPVVDRVCKALKSSRAQETIKSFSFKPLPGRMHDSVFLPIPGIRGVFTNPSSVLQHVEIDLAPCAHDTSRAGYPDMVDCIRGCLSEMRALRSGKLSFRVTCLLYDLPIPSEYNWKRQFQMISAFPSTLRELELVFLLNSKFTRRRFTYRDLNIDLFKSCLDNFVRLDSVYFRHQYGVEPADETYIRSAFPTFAQRGALRFDPQAIEEYANIEPYFPEL